MDKPRDRNVIYVFNIVRRGWCALSGHGDKVFQEITESLKQDKPVVLSFKGVDLATLTFLQHAIGQLYGHFSEEKIKELLKVEDIEPYELDLLKKVVDNAKRYFREKKGKANNEL